MKISIFLMITSAVLSMQSFCQSLPKVQIKTNMGEIIIEIDTLNAPVTGKNFLYVLAINRNWILAEIEIPTGKVLQLSGRWLKEWMLYGQFRSKKIKSRC